MGLIRVPGHGIVLSTCNDLSLFPLSLLLQTELALRFELTGGFIKNAILSALSIAVSRNGDSPEVCQKDLLQGANLQLRGRLRMKVGSDVVVTSLLVYCCYIWVLAPSQLSTSKHYFS